MRVKDHSPLGGGEGRSPSESGESGQGLAEYTFIIAMVTFVCIVALTLLGEAIVDLPGWSIP